MRKAILLLMTANMVLLAGCSDFGEKITDGNNNPDTLISFSSDIQPILNANCSGCHVGGNQGGLTLDSYNDLMKGGDSGPVVRAGIPDSSLLVLRIEGVIQPRMPLGGQPLAEAEILLIRRWILQGTHDN